MGVGGLEDLIRCPLCCRRGGTLESSVKMPDSPQSRMTTDDRTKRQDRLEWTRDQVMMYCQNDRDQKDKVRPGENLFMERQTRQTILAPESVGNSVGRRLCARGRGAPNAQCPVLALPPPSCLLRRPFCEPRRRETKKMTRSTETVSTSEPLAPQFRSDKIISRARYANRGIAQDPRLQGCDSSLCASRNRVTSRA